MFNRRQFTAAGLAALSVSCRKKPAPGFDGYVFIANAESNTVSVVDLASFSVIRRLAVAGAPTLVMSRGGSGIQKPSVLVLVAQTGEVCEIPVETLAIARRVKIDSPAISMKLSDDGRTLWVLGEQHKLVGVDMGSFRISTQIHLPSQPYDFDVSKNLAVISYGKAGSVSQVDLSTRAASKAVRIGDEVGHILFRKDGGSLLLANTGGNMLTVLSPGDGQVVTHLPLAIRPDRLCFNQDGGQLFITGPGRDAVVVVFPYYVPQVAETVLAGHAPGVMAASNQYLFIANPDAGDLSILNIQLRKVIAVAKVGVGPASITITPDNQFALVLNRDSGDMSVIRIQGINFSRSKRAGVFWIVPVGSKPVSAAVTAVA